MSYDETSTEDRLPDGTRCWHLSRQIVVTNRIVRRIIEHAIDKHGFDPLQMSKQLSLLNVDKMIDMSDVERSD